MGLKGTGGIPEPQPLFAAMQHASSKAAGCVILHGRPPRDTMDHPGRHMCLDCNNGAIFLADERIPGPVSGPILQMNLHELECPYPGMTSLMHDFKVQCNSAHTDDKRVRYDSSSDPGFYVIVMRKDLASVKAAAVVAFPESLQKTPSREATDDTELHIQLFEEEHKTHGVTFSRFYVQQFIKHHKAVWEANPLPPDQMERLAKLAGEAPGDGSACGAAASCSDGVERSAPRR